MSTRLQACFILHFLSSFPLWEWKMLLLKPRNTKADSTQTRAMWDFSSNERTLKYYWNTAVPPTDEHNTSVPPSVASLFLSILVLLLQNLWAACNTFSDKHLWKLVCKRLLDYIFNTTSINNSRHAKLMRSEMQTNELWITVFIAFFKFIYALHLPSVQTGLLTSRRLWGELMSEWSVPRTAPLLTPLQLIDLTIHLQDSACDWRNLDSLFFCLK